MICYFSYIFFNYKDIKFVTYLEFQPEKLWKEDAPSDVTFS